MAGGRPRPVSGGSHTNAHPLADRRHGADTGAPGDSPIDTSVTLLPRTSSSGRGLTLVPPGRKRRHPSAPERVARTRESIGQNSSGSRAPPSAGRPEDGASRTRDSKSSRTVLVLARQQHRRAGEKQPRDQEKDSF